MNPTKPLSRRSIYHGRILDVALEEHRLPNGRTAVFEVVRHSGGAAVLPLLDDGRVLLVRQYRPAVGTMVYEIPAGRLEDGESPEVCAHRELMEEAGYRAGNLEPLGGVLSAVGYCDELVSLFIARDLVQTGQALEPDEVLELTAMSFEEALARIDAGEITDSKTQVALLRLQRHFKEQGDDRSA